MELKIVRRDGTGAAVPVEELRWTTKLGSAGVLDFTSPCRSFRAGEGDRVLLSSGQQAVFDGFVFLSEDDGKRQRAVCYDRVKYLLYKDTKVFRNKSAADIVREILREQQLAFGTIQDTGYALPSLAKEGQPLLSMIQTALDETLAATGRTFVFYDDTGLLTLRDAAANPAGVLLCGENQLISYRKTSDIDGDTFNRFKIWQEDGRSGFRRVTVADDLPSQQKWGVLQYFERVDSQLNPAQISGRIQSLMNAKCRARASFDMECLADVACRAGKTALVRLSDADPTENYLVEEAEHHFQGGAGRMKLKLRRLS